MEGPLPDVDGSDSDEEDPHRSPAAAAKQFIEILLELYMASQLSAEHFAVMCYWCELAGMAHVSPFAKPPGRQSGYYAAHISSVLGFDLVKKHMYRLSLVGKDPESAGRSDIMIPAKPPHEVAREHHESSAMATIALMEAKENGTLPASYYSHPVVQAHPDELVQPWGLYLDAVPYSLIDSVLGVWLIDLISGVRTLVCLMRKKLSCQCGCRGWCTWYGLMRWLRWSFEALAQKTMPAGRHDFLEWDQHDSRRSSLAGGTSSIVEFCSGSKGLGGILQPIRLPYLGVGNEAVPMLPGSG